jgi:hypothetical protein
MSKKLFKIPTLKWVKLAKKSSCTIFMLLRWKILLSKKHLKGAMCVLIIQENSDTKFHCILQTAPTIENHMPI